MKNEIKIAHVHLETPLLVSEKFVQLLIIGKAVIITEDLGEILENYDDLWYK